MNDYLLHYVISLAMITMSGVLIGFFALTRRRYDPSAITFSLYCLAISWWAFWQIFMIVPTNLARAHVAGKISQIGVALIATFFFHFCIRFLGSTRGLDRLLVWVSYVFSVLVLALIPTPYFTGETVTKFDGKVAYLVAGPVDIFYISYFFLIVSYALVRLIKAHSEAQGYRRQQIKWVILGTLIAYVGGGGNYFLSFGIDPFPWVPFGNYGVVANFLCFGYAIFRYRLLDVDDVIEKIRATRAAAFGIVSGSLHHEIKNPLFVIRGKTQHFLSKWKRGMLSPEEQEKVFHEILQQTDRIYQIVTNALDFLKPSASLQVEEVNLIDALDHVLSVVGYQLKFDDIKLEKKIAAGLSPIRANRCQIEEILFNLIVNACQAMKGLRGGTLTVEMVPGRVRISDTGLGLSSNIRDRLFEPFATSREEGVGLGLYVTKQLVERNDGRIRFETSPKGTSFYVEFGK